jgi:hypothetical protein
MVSLAPSPTSQNNGYGWMEVTVSGDTPARNYFLLGLCKRGKKV